MNCIIVCIIQPHSFYFDFKLWNWKFDNTTEMNIFVINCCCVVLSFLSLFTENYVMKSYVVMAMRKSATAWSTM